MKISSLADIIRSPIIMFLDFYGNRELIWQFTKRNIQAQTKGSYLGILWSVFTPLLSFTVYATVFGVIFNGRYKVIENETSAQYAMGIFLSLNLFSLLADSIATSSGLIYSQPNYVKKVVFPLQILPISSMASNIYRFIVSMLLCFAGILILTDIHISINLLMFPLLVLPIILLGQGLAFLISALGVFIRDITHVTQALTMVLLYSSAVFYSSHLVMQKGPAFWAVLRFNPLIHITEQSRNLLLWNLPLDFYAIGYCYAVGLFVLLFGYIFFTNLKMAFADVI